MVVFKCLLLFLVIVFFIHGTHTKPAHNEQSKASGISSTLWGWVSYINPWGSSADTSTASTPKQDQVIHLNQVKIKPVVRARQLTAATIPVESTADESTSDKSLKHDVTTTPKFMSVQTSTTTKPTTEDLVITNVSLTGVKSAQNTLDLEKSATEYSVELKTSTSPIALVQYHPTKTKESRLEYHLEIENYSTTPIAVVNDNPTTTQKPTIVDSLEPTAPTTYIALDLEKLTTTEESATKQPLEHETLTFLSLNDTNNKERPTIDLLEAETSTTLITMNQNISPLTEETVTEQSLELVITTISFMPDLGNATIVEKPLESEAAALNTPKVIDYQLEPEMLTPPIDMATDFPTLTEEIPIKQQLSSTALALNNPTTEVPTTDDSLEPETATTLILIDQNTRNTAIRVEITTEHSLKLEVATEEEAVVPTEVVFTATLSTGIEGAATSGQHVTYMGSDEPLTTKPDLDPYTKLHDETFLSTEGVSSWTDPTVALSKSLHDVMFNLVEVVSTTGPVNPYQGVTDSVLVRDELITEISEASILAGVTDAYPQVTIVVPETDGQSLERHKASTPTELVTDIVSAVTASEKSFTERRNGSIETEAATNPYTYPEVVVDEESSEGSEAIPAEIITNPSTKIEEAPFATELAPNQFSELKEAISTTSTVKISMEKNGVNEATFTEKYEAIDVSRVLRSRSAGFKLSFDHCYLMTLLYAVYFLKQ